MPHLRELVELNKDNPFALIGVNADAIRPSITNPPTRRQKPASSWLGPIVAPNRGSCCP